jgi:hypothetical protein
MVQLVECLPSKCEALSLNSSTSKKKKKKEKKVQCLGCFSGYVIFCLYPVCSFEIRGDKYLYPQVCVRMKLVNT